MYNANAIAKYIEIAGSSDWLWMLNGDRANQMKRWITNRLAYLDSKYDYNTDAKSIIARFDIADTQGFEVSVKTSIHQWVTAQLGNSTAGFMKTRTSDNAATLSHSYANGTELPFVEFELFNGQYITELVNMKDLPLRTLQIGEAEQLRILDLSKASANSVLQSVSFGSNNELEEIDLSNNSGLSGMLDLSNASKLRKLDLRGTSITSIIFPIGGVLTEVYLPSTITTLELLDQTYLQEVSLAAGTNLDTLRIENTTINSLQLILDSASLDNVRIMGLEFSTNDKQLLLDVVDTVYDGSSFLVGGITDLGVLTSIAKIAGEVRLYSATDFSSSEYDLLGQALPDLTINVVVPNSDFTFTDMGEYYEVASYTGNSANLTVPVGFNEALISEDPVYQYNFDYWKPVLGIGEAAFRFNTTLENINLPDDLEYIGDFAFDAVTSLRPVMFTPKLTSIGEAAFRGDQYFNVLYIPLTVTTIGSDAFTVNQVSDNDLIVTAHPSKPTG